LRALSRGMASGGPKIHYTHTDEAPMLATYALLPVIRRFTEPAGIRCGCGRRCAAIALTAPAAPTTRCTPMPPLLRLAASKKSTFLWRRASSRSSPSA
jgi:hypothetical protein